MQANLQDALYRHAEVSVLLGLVLAAVTLLLFNISLKQSKRLAAILARGETGLAVDLKVTTLLVRVAFIYVWILIAAIFAALNLFQAKTWLALFDSHSAAALSAGAEPLQR